MNLGRKGFPPLSPRNGGQARLQQFMIPPYQRREGMIAYEAYLQFIQYKKSQNNMQQYTSPF